jgi:hypothetical protein
LLPKAALRFMGTKVKYAYIALDRAVQDSGLKKRNMKKILGFVLLLGKEESASLILWKLVMPCWREESAGRIRWDPSVSLVLWDPHAVPSWQPASKFRDPVSLHRNWYGANSS